MANWTDVKTYIKAQLALPSTFIEDNDNEIQQYLILTALQEYSSFIPSISRAVVSIDSSANTIAGSRNKFRFYDEENLPIFAIKECYFTAGSDAFIGQPIFGPLSFNGMESFSLNTFKSKLFSKYSDFSKSFQYRPPNIVEIFPDTNESFVVEYERLQPHDLSELHNTMNMYFYDLCLAHYMLKLGTQRSIYGDDAVQSVFGSIPLKGAELLSKGTDLREKVVDILKENAIPQGMLYLC